MKQTIFLILLLCAMLYASNASSESVNPFNSYMKPEGGINLTSGDASLSLPIHSGGGLNVAFAYSSNVTMNVPTRNDKAPTGWVGLGWAYGNGYIECRHNGTRGHDDDQFYWIAATGVKTPMVPYFTDGNDHSTTYRLINNKNMKIKMISGDDDIILGWEFTDVSGNRIIFGDDKIGDRNLQNGIAYTIAWPSNKGGHVGPGSAEGAENYPYKWYMTASTDIYDNAISYHYDTIQSEYKYDHGELSYTREVYLRKIHNDFGDSVVFYREKKSEQEYFDPHQELSEPDRFMERFETERLETIKIFKDEFVVKKFKLCYEELSIFPSKHFTKSLLTALVEFDNNGSEIGRVLIDYLDDIQKYNELKDDVKGYNLGAINSITYPTCGTVNYTYEKKFSNQTNAKEIAGHKVWSKEWEKNTFVIHGTYNKGNDYYVTKNKVVGWNGVSWDTYGSSYNGKCEPAAGNNYYAYVEDTPGDIIVYFWNAVEENWDKRVFSNLLAPKNKVKRVQIIGDVLVCIDSDPTVVGPKNTYLFRVFPHTQKIKPIAMSEAPTYGLWDINVNTTEGGQIYIVYSIRDKQYEDIDKMQKKVPTQMYIDMFDLGKKTGPNGIKAYEPVRYSITDGPDDERTLTSVNTSIKGKIIGGYNNYAYNATGGMHINGKEHVYAWRWTGEAWVKDLNAKRLKKASEFSGGIYSGSNFFIIDHDKPRHKISTFTWDGESWFTSLDYFKLGKRGLDVSSSPSIFAASYDKWISNKKQKAKCRRRKYRSRLFTGVFDEGSWAYFHDDKFGLGSRSQKMFSVANDYLLGYEIANTKRFFVDNFRVNTRMHTGMGWEATSKAFPDIPLNVNDSWKGPFKYLYPTIHNARHSCLVQLIIGSIEDRGKKCQRKSLKDHYKENIEEWGKDDRKYRLIARNKFQDGFPEYLWHYVVTEKRITQDHMSNKSNPDVEIDLPKSPNDIVTTYDYNTDKKVKYHCVAGTALYENMSVVSVDGSKTSYTFDVSSSLTSSKLLKKEKYTSDGILLEKSTLSYDVILDRNTNSSLQGTYSVVLKQKSSEVKGAKSYTLNSYNKRGFVDTVTSINADGVQSISVTTYLADKESSSNPYGGMEVVEKMRDLNMFSIPYQSFSAKKVKGEFIFEGTECSEYQLIDDLPILKTKHMYKGMVERYNYLSDLVFDKTLRQPDDGSQPDNKLWYNTGQVSKVDPKGRVTETIDVLVPYLGNGLPTSTIVNNKDGKPIGIVKGAYNSECAILTGYDNDTIVDNIEYYDYEQGWIKGNSEYVPPLIQINNKDIPFPHFNAKAFRLQVAGAGPRKVIPKLTEGVSYKMSAWVLPTDPDISLFLSVKSGDDDIVENYKGNTHLRVNEWNYIERIIPASQLTGIKEVEIGVLLGDLTTTCYVEDIRFAPRTSEVSTNYYDDLGRIVTTVNNVNNSSKSAYDNQSRITKTYIPGNNLTAENIPNDTIISEQSFLRGNCSNRFFSLELESLLIAKGSDDDKVSLIEFDPETNNYTLVVDNTVESVRLETIPKNKSVLQQLIVTGNPSFNEESNCPCGLNRDIPLGANINTEIKVIVKPQNESAPNIYTVTIRRLDKCWVYSGEQSFDDRFSKERNIYFDGTIPYQTMLSRSGDFSMFKKSGDNWDVVPSTGLPSAIQNYDVLIKDGSVYLATTTVEGSQVWKGDLTLGDWQNISSFPVDEAIQVDLEEYNNELHLFTVAPTQITTDDDEGDEFYPNKVYWRSFSMDTWSTKSLLALGTPSELVSDYSISSIDVSSSDNDMYIAFQGSISDEDNVNDETAVYYNESVFVTKFSNSSIIGGKYVSDANISNFDLSVTNAGIYIAVSEQLNTDEVHGYSERLQVYTFDSEWKSLDPLNKDICYYKNGDQFALTTLENKPCLAILSSLNSYKLSIAMFDLGQWRTYGVPAFVQSSGNSKNAIGFANAGETNNFVNVLNPLRDNQSSILEWNGSCDDANLVDIKIKSANSEYILFPEFRQYLVNYETEIDAETELVTISVKDRVNHDNSSDNVSAVSIGGKQASKDALGYWAVELSIPTGEAKIPIQVIAADGEVSAFYYIKTNRPLVINNNICNLTLYEVDNGEFGDEIDITPEFSPLHYEDEYSVTVPFSTNSIYIVAETAEGGFISINGTKAFSGKKGTPFELKYGENNIQMSAGEGKFKKYYTLIVTREIDPNLSLSSMIVNGTPFALEDDKTVYERYLESHITTVSFVPTASDNTHKILFNNIEVASGAAVDGLELSYGENVIPISVENTTTGDIIYYAFKLYRKPSDECRLSNVTVVSNKAGAVPIVPAFDSDKFHYSATVENSVQTITIYPEKYMPGGVISINGGEFDYNNFVFELVEGNNHFEILSEFNEDEDDENKAVYSLDIYKKSKEVIPAIFFEKSKLEYPESSNGGKKYTAKFKVKLSSAPLYETTFQYRIIGEGLPGSATTVINEPGTNQDAHLIDEEGKYVESGELTFALCENEKEIQLVVYDDNYIEGDETVTIELFAESNQDPDHPEKITNTLGTSQMVFTIIDDDFPTLSFGDATSDILEGGEGQKQEIKIPVFLDNAPIKNINVPFEIVYKTPELMPEEFEIVNSENMLFFSPSVLDQFITVKVVGDFDYENDESIRFQIQRPEGITSGTMNHLLTIKDDDIKSVEDKSGVIYVDNTKHLGKNDGTSWENAFVSLQDGLDAAANYQPDNSWKNALVQLTRTEDPSSSHELVENSIKIFNRGAEELVIKQGSSFDFYLYNEDVNEGNIDKLGGSVYYFNPGVDETNHNNQLEISFEYLGETYDLSSERKANVRVRVLVKNGIFTIPSKDYATLEFGYWGRNDFTQNDDWSSVDEYQVPQTVDNIVILNSMGEKVKGKAPLLSTDIQLSVSHQRMENSDEAECVAGPSIFIYNKGSQEIPLNELVVDYYLFHPGFVEYKQYPPRIVSHPWYFNPGGTSNDYTADMQTSNKHLIEELDEFIINGLKADIVVSSSFDKEHKIPVGSYATVELGIIPIHHNGSEICGLEQESDWSFNGATWGELRPNMYIVVRTKSGDRLWGKAPTDKILSDIPEIWVAKGNTYFPENKYSGFSIPGSTPIKIYGGFEGYKGEILSDRSINAHTTIDGDINRDGKIQDDYSNASTLFSCGGTNSDIRIDGFKLRNCNVDAKNGAPIQLYSSGLISGDVNVDIINCEFENNAVSGGSGWKAACIYWAIQPCNITSNLNIDRSQFSNNILYSGATNWLWPVIGGEMDNTSVTNSIFFSNKGETIVSGKTKYADLISSSSITSVADVQISNSSVVGNSSSNIVSNTSLINNSILWNNDFQGLDNTGITYSFTSLPGVNNQYDATGPQFVSYPSEPKNISELALSETSPCINTGNNDYVDDHQKDFYGNGRIIQEVVDKGAIESNHKLTDVIFVNNKANGLNTGKTWNDAFYSLQAGLDRAATISKITGNPVEIWVAKGYGYFPPDFNGFVMSGSIKMYGGFEGVLGETLDNRTPGERTVINGDIDKNGINDKNNSQYLFQHTDMGFKRLEINGFSCVNNVGQDEHSAVINVYGPVDKDGYLVIDNCHFAENHASSAASHSIVLNWQNKHPQPTDKSYLIIKNSIIEKNGGNTTTESLLTSYNRTTSLIEDCIFMKNSVGMIARLHTNITVKNCTFNGNKLIEFRAPFLEIHKSIVFNSIFWDNTNFDLTSVDFRNSFIEKDGEGNIFHPLGPVFITTPNEPVNPSDLQLHTTSPCINSGNDSYVSIDNNFDIGGENRILHGTVDMGAYESSHDNRTIIYVDDDASGSNSGENWDNAFNHLQDALALGRTYNGEPVVIKIAEGLYSPDKGSVSDEVKNSRYGNPGYTLFENLSLMGGYPNGGGSDDERSSILLNDNYISTLSGSLNNGDHSGILLDWPSEGSKKIIIDGFKFQGAKNTIMGNPEGDPNEHPNWISNMTSDIKIVNCLFDGGDNSQTAIDLSFIDASLTLVNTDFVSFKSPSTANLIQISNDEYATDVVVNGCKFLNNKNARAILVTSESEIPSMASLVVTGCSFENNHMPGIDHGWDLITSYRLNSVKLNNSLFKNNYDVPELFDLWYTTNSDSVKNLSFEDNKAIRGGILLPKKKCVLENLNFDGNEIIDFAIIVGADDANSSTELTGCQFENGIQNQLIFQGGNVTISDVTISSSSFIGTRPPFRFEGQNILDMTNVSFNGNTLNHNYVMDIKGAGAGSYYVNGLTIKNNVNTLPYNYSLINFGHSKNQTCDDLIITGEVVEGNSINEELIGCYLRSSDIDPVRTNEIEQKPIYINPWN